MKKVYLLVFGAAALSLAAPLFSATAVQPMADTSSEQAADEAVNFDDAEFEKMIQKLQAHMEGVKAKMSPEKKARLDAIEGEMKTLGESLNNLQSEFADAEQEKITQKDEVKELRNRITNLEQDRDQLAATIAVLEQDVSSDQAELALKKEELAKVEAEIAELKASLEEKREAKRQTKAKIKSHSEEITKREEEMNKKTEENAQEFGGTEGFDMESFFADFGGEDEADPLENADDSDFDTEAELGAEEEAGDDVATVEEAEEEVAPQEDEAAPVEEEKAE